MKKFGVVLSLALSCALVADTLQVESGWNLLSVSVPSTTADCLLGQLPTGSKMYKYDNVEKKWLAKANTQELNDLFMQRDCFADSMIVRSIDGFWIYNPAQPTTINQTCKDMTADLAALLSDEQKYALAYMWNEEKLAKDIYLALNDLYPHQTLYNIATRSEVEHEAAVEALVQKYDINITNLKDYEIHYSPEELRALGPGKYAVPEVQALYDTLYAKGSQSLQDALEVGCMVEVTDVEDLDRYIEIADGKEDLVTTFEFLRSGSYNHYWAFDRALKNLGVENGCCTLGERYCKTPEEFPANNMSKGQDQRAGQGNGYRGGRR